ncbi:MAG TPA: mitofilin family membrane protein [Alphaproteobacteria bacterium]
MTEEKGLDSDALGNAADIIERFGGIRPMATKMAVPVTTVQGWKKRNVIPGNRRNDVLRAAQSNNIDISDIIEKGAANENGAAQVHTATASDIYADAPASRDFSTEIKTALRIGKATDEKHERAVAAGQETFAHEDSMMKKIRAAERRAVQKSALVSLLLLGVTGVIAAVLLLPVQNQVAGFGQRLSAVESDVKNMHGETSSFQNLLPEEWQERLSMMEEQASLGREKISMLSAAVENLMVNGAQPLAARIGALEQKVQTLTGGSTDIAAWLDKFRALQESVQGQQQIAHSAKALNSIVQGLQGRMDEFDAALQTAKQEDPALGATLEGVSDSDLKAAALLVGLAQLRTSLNRNAPFEEDLALLQKMLGENDPELNEAVTRLTPQAKRGVLSPAGLSDEFRTLASDIVVASLKGEDVSMKERAMARLNDVLQIQKNGEMVTGTDTQATVARAQKMLDEGNIDGAITELQTLQGEAANAAQPWMNEAQVTLQAQQVVDLLMNKIGGIVHSGGNPMGTTGLKSVLRGIENIGTGGGTVTTDPQSGFSILPGGTAR